MYVNTSPVPFIPATCIPGTSCAARTAADCRFPPCPCEHTFSGRRKCDLRRKTGNQTDEAVFLLKGALCAEVGSTSEKNTGEPRSGIGLDGSVKNGIDAVFISLPFAN